MPPLTPRAESLRLTRSGYIPPHELPDIHTSRSEEEVTAILDEMKPKQYAQLAKVIDMLLSDLLQKPSPSGDEPAFGPTRKTDDPWEHLRRDILNSTFQSIVDISDTREYKDASETTWFIGVLDMTRHRDLALQLHAGMNTASGNMLSLIRNIPELVAAHAPASADLDIVEVARNSKGLSWPFAMTCVNRMMAARSVIADGDPEEKVLDPDHFRIQMHDDGTASIKLVDFAGIEIPEGYKTRSWKPGLSEATTVGELACHQAITIGCPITLLKGRMEELWNWHIDLVLERRLWEAIQSNS